MNDIAMANGGVAETPLPRIPDDAPERFEWAGTEYAIHLSATDSGGAIGIFEGMVPPGDGPPLHVHRREDEVLHILEGTFEFWLDGERSIHGKGASVFLPCGVPHTFRAVGESPSRYLAIVTPGGFEDLFVEAAAAGLQIPGDLDALGRLAERFDLEFTGPPLAAM